MGFPAMAYRITRNDLNYILSVAGLGAIAVGGVAWGMVLLMSSAPEPVHSSVADPPQQSRSTEVPKPQHPAQTQSPEQPPRKLTLPPTPPPREEKPDAPPARDPPPKQESQPDATPTEETADTPVLAEEDELQGAALRAYIRQEFARTKVLSYPEARRQMFATIDDPDGDDVIFPVYTGTAFKTSDIPDHRIVNTEHTWPQSRFSNPALKTDLHNLFPTYSQINRIRGNHPFGTIPDNQRETLWCGPGNQFRQQQPHGDLEKYSQASETHFEPPASHRGNVARALFYFAVLYEQESIDMPWFAAQVPTLRKWHQQDPVDEAERARSKAIARVQGNENPFVVHPEFLERVLADVPQEKLTP